MSQKKSEGGKEAKSNKKVRKKWERKKKLRKRWRR